MSDCHKKFYQVVNISDVNFAHIILMSFQVQLFKMVGFIMMWGVQFWDKLLLFLKLSPSLTALFKCLVIIWIPNLSHLLKWYWSVLGWMMWICVPLKSFMIGSSNILKYFSTSHISLHSRHKLNSTYLRYDKSSQSSKDTVHTTVRNYRHLLK